MTVEITVPELQLPWESSGVEDKHFHRLLGVMLSVFLVAGLIVPMLPMPEIVHKTQEQPPPTFARVILEKKVLPPPVVVPVKPKPKPTVIQKKRPKRKVAKAPIKKPQPSLAQAKAQAALSGVMQFQDELLKLRDKIDPNTLNQTAKLRGEGQVAQAERSIITSSSKTGSGGIATTKVSRNAGGVALSTRETTRVASHIVDSAAREFRNSASAQRGGRSDESIRRIMDQHKGTIFSVYNRALRKDPLLEGKLVFEMVIDAAGTVTEVKLLSSTLADQALTQKILARIRMIRFGREQVLTTRLNYSLDFLPYS